MTNFLKKLLSVWMIILKPIGILQSRLIFFIIFIFLVSPLGLITRLRDPLNLKSKKPAWLPRKEHYQFLAELQKQ